MVATQERLGAERRATDRFPIESDLRYKLIEAKFLAETGQGRTLNMSSGGILFTAEGSIPVGRRVEVSVEWPAQLNERCGLTLVALEEWCGRTRQLPLCASKSTISARAPPRP